MTPARSTPRRATQVATRAGALAALVLLVAAGAVSCAGSRIRVQGDGTPVTTSVQDVEGCPAAQGLQIWVFTTNSAASKQDPAEKQRVLKGLKNAAADAAKALPQYKKDIDEIVKDQTDKLNGTANPAGPPSDRMSTITNYLATHCPQADKEPTTTAPGGK